MRGTWKTLKAAGVSRLIHKSYQEEQEGREEKRGFCACLQGEFIKITLKNQPQKPFRGISIRKSEDRGWEDN